MVAVSGIFSHLRSAPRRGTSDDATEPARPGRVGLIGEPAPTLGGVTPTGQMAGPETVDGMILFLTSTCLACVQVWAGLLDGGHLRLPGAPSLLVVTPDPTLEDRRRVASLAPSGVRVLMSTAMWEAYRVATAPWVVVVSDGTVSSEGPAEGWDDVAAIGAVVP